MTLPCSREPNLTCQDFLDWHTAFRKGSSAGMPSADATTEKARAVVFRTYSSMLSMSGRIAAIIVARPAAFDKLAMISRPCSSIDQHKMGAMVLASMAFEDEAQAPNMDHSLGWQ
jgi:hypothetical protein